MTDQAGEVGRLRNRASLLLVVCLWQWTQATLAIPCEHGELRIIGKGKEKCCPKCFSSAGDDRPCESIADNDCKCRQGYSCSDSSCRYCIKLPDCEEGEELVKLGDFDFRFKCKPCKIGTYSRVKNGWCRNWTDCESSGFQTIKQGNSTHNTMCGFSLEQDNSLYTTILAILTAVALFVLILLTFFLHFCIWSLKKEKYHAPNDLEHNFHRLPEAPQLSHHREETYSCQFPEEEHGDKTPEEKMCYFSPHSPQ